MALFICPECGNMISNKAVKCPKCGCPVGQRIATTLDHPDESRKIQPSRKWLYAVICFLIAALVGGGIVAYNKLFSSNKVNVTISANTSTDNWQSAYNTQNYNLYSLEKDRTEHPTPQEIQEIKGQKGIYATLKGEISTIRDVKMVLQGKTGKLTYVMDGKLIVSNIVMDEEASQIDNNGFGQLVLKSFTPEGKLKGRFIGEMNVAECGYYYSGRFVNVNGSSTDFFLTE